MSCHRVDEKVTVTVRVGMVIGSGWLQVGTVCLYEVDWFGNKRVSKVGRGKVE
jgi:hypothetical protein